MADGDAVTHVATSPLADELREAADEGTHDAAELARGVRHLRVRTTRLPGGRHGFEPVGPALTGPDALLVAEVPNTPIARARLHAIQLHGALSMAGDPFEDPDVIEQEIQQLCASILLEWGAHRKGTNNAT